MITPKGKLFKLGKISKSDWQKLGNKARSEMLTRTRKHGLDVNKEKFSPYSEKTLQKKQAQMKKRGTPEHVNLTDTGKMNRSMAVEVKGQSAEIYYSDIERAKIALKHQTGDPVARLPQREHFGFNQDDSEKYAKEIGKLQIKANLKAQLGGSL